MSSQRGNVQKCRAPKHPNKTVFKNDLHDKTKKIQEINRLEVCDVCQRCKDIIQWKIKYKKYKPLTAPKKCTICFEKTVKQAYNIMCMICAKKKNVCAKCGEGKDIVQQSSGLTPAQKAAEEAEFQREIGMLPERQRRKFVRLHEQGKLTKEDFAAAIGNNGSDEDSDIEIVNSDDEKDSDIEILKLGGHIVSSSKTNDKPDMTSGVLSHMENKEEKIDSTDCDLSKLSLPKS